MQTRWRSSDLQLAVELTEVLLSQFEDPEDGGFFFTAADHERLIHRSKTYGDDSLPSGNGVAASVLCRLGYLLGEPRYLDAAQRTLRAGWPSLNEYPQAHMALLNALDDQLSPMQILIVRGESAAVALWAEELGALYAPTRMIFAVPADAADLPEAIAVKAATERTTVYLCTGMTCSAPITDLNEVARRLTLRIG